MYPLPIVRASGLPFPYPREKLIGDSGTHNDSKYQKTFRPAFPRVSQQPSRGGVSSLNAMRSMAEFQTARLRCSKDDQTDPQPLFLALFDNDQVGIGNVQRRAILGKFHFDHVFLSGFSREAPEEFENVPIRIFGVALTCARSMVNDIAIIQDPPVRPKQGIIACAIFQVARTSGDTHHALHFLERKGLFDLNHDPIPMRDRSEFWRSDSSYCERHGHIHDRVSVRVFFMISGGRTGNKEQPT
jgi:hypothetical protein